MQNMPHYHFNVNGDLLTKHSVTIEAELSNWFGLEHSPDGRLALIDRDGVIIEKAGRHKYHTGLESIVPIDGAAEAIKHLNDRKIPVVLVTNQPGIYKGLLSKEALFEMNMYMQDLLNKIVPGVSIDGVIYCPHPAPTEGDAVEESENCLCRKPKPGMLNAMVSLYSADKSKTFMFGDFASDIAAATNAGVNPVYVATRHDEFEEMQRVIKKNYPKIFNKAQYPNLLDAVKSVY